jgi:hypothetical protein
VIIAAPTLAFTDILPPGATETKSIVVTGSSLTGEITATLSGEGSQAFTLSASTLPAAGDSLHITYAPEVARKDTVTLTLTAVGANPVVVLLTGNSDVDFPRISNDENAYWYFIQFVRSEGKGAEGVNKSLHSGGIEGFVTQEDHDPEQPLQQWKIVGNWNSYKIVGYDDEEFVFNLDNQRIMLAESGQGHNFKFVRNTSAGKWQLYNLDTDDGEEDGHRYLNDFGGQDHTEVGMWSVNDGGNSLNFIPVDGPNSISGIAIDDELVSKRYYNLLGVEVNTPSATGIYIVKEVYASKKTKAYKVLKTKN